jgi:hypothetical protein
MKRFFRKLTGFIALLVGLLLLSYWSNRELLSNNKYYIDESVQTIIMGSSLAGCGINPTYFDDAVNISSNAEPFMLSYLKLKDVLPESNSVKTVILTCSYPEIFIREDIWFNENRALAVALYRRALFYNELPAFRFFRPIADNPILYYEAIIRNRILLMQALSLYGIQKEKKEAPLIVGYNYVDQDYDPDFVNINNERDKIDYEYYSREFDISLIENEWGDLAYVDSVIRFTQKQDFGLVLVAMPININLYNKISPKCRMEFELIKQRFSNFEHVRFFDFSDSLEDPSFFRDHAHLRALGADSISKVINDHINKKY